MNSTLDFVEAQTRQSLGLDQTWVCTKRQRTEKAIRLGFTRENGVKVLVSMTAPEET